jgi:nucleoside-diphosphate-sugar epimerase
MSRVVVIGATGHIGTYLVPRLVDRGHAVISVSRGTRGPYHASPQWDAVTSVTADREAEDAAGMFGRRIAALHPDVVIDLICFSAGSARQLLEELRPKRPLLVHCGTIWIHGRSFGREHTSRSITASIARAREVLGYAPRYSSLDALREALAWLVANGQADVGGQPFPAASAY